MVTSKKQLSVPRQQLLKLMQRMYFCRIKNLRIIQGEPILDPWPEVIQDIKLDGDNNSRQESQLCNFELKPQHRELLNCFDSVHEGTISQIDVRHGLPCRVLVLRGVLT